jgi:Ran GTPase-activating protein (RanGAP) involved in mRNA processing and transport
MKGKCWENLPEYRKECNAFQGLIPDVKPILSVDTAAEIEAVKEEGSDREEKPEADEKEEEEDRRDMKIRRTVTQVDGIYNLFPLLAN